MLNLSESVQFAPELRVPPLVQRLGASLIQRIGRRSLSSALDASGRSCVSVLIDCCCSDIDVPLLRLQLGLGARYWEQKTGVKACYY